MLHCAHRMSRAIDVFLKDAQALPLLSPRLNDRAAGLARDHVEASNFVKLACTDGEIDFIVAPDLTERPRETRALGGREIAVHAPRGRERRGPRCAPRLTAKWQCGGSLPGEAGGGIPGQKRSGTEPAPAPSHFGYPGDPLESPGSSQACVYGQVVLIGG